MRVTSDSAAPCTTSARPGNPAGAVIDHESNQPGVLPSRAADNLYWLGRYVERAENAVRLLRAYHLRQDEDGVAENPLSGYVAGYLGRAGLSPAQPMPDGLLQLFDLSKGCAGKVRDRFSIDGWNALQDLSRNAREMAPRVAPGDDAAGAMSVLLRKLAGFSGLVHDNMFHFTGWRFLAMGRALERALQASRFLKAFTDPAAPDGSLDVAIEVGDSVMSHRRRYSVESDVRTVVDLLVLDGDNPRSIRFQVDALKEQESRLPQRGGGGMLSDAAKALLELQTELAVAAPADITPERFDRIATEIASVSDALTQRYMG